MLFADDAAGDALKQTLVVFKARGEALRFRLRLDPPELETVGWERILAPLDGQWQPLAAAAATPFSRYVLAQDWERPAPVTDRPLKLLAVIASPGNLEEFGLDPIRVEERQALHDLLDALPDVAVTCLELGTAAPPTVKALSVALAGGYHIVHFLCHGAATSCGTALYLEDDAGQVDVTKADRLLDAFTMVKIHRCCASWQLARAPRQPSRCLRAFGPGPRPTLRRAGRDCHVRPDRGGNCAVVHQPVLCPPAQPRPGRPGHKRGPPAGTRAGPIRVGHPRPLPAVARRSVCLPLSSRIPSARLDL